MNVIEEIKNIRELAIVLKKWDLIAEEKRLAAIWGRGHGFDGVKVRNTPNDDYMENAIISLQEMEECKQELFVRFWDGKERLMKIIEQYAKVDDLTPLHRYIIGCELPEIPLVGKQKNPASVVNGALKRLQKMIDREEELKRQPKAVQSLIRGERLKCGKCAEGYIKYGKEEPDKFIFVCTGCGRRLKADKKGI